RPQHRPTRPMATDARSICPDDRQAREEAGRPLTADPETRLAFAAEIAANTFAPKHPETLRTRKLLAPSP
ncbi:MAG: hypothetical protein KUG77_14290, partial [Nannocystaceae bacterium]|nr:hypothetical protein [Nannocystaceae bacterium]